MKRKFVSLVIALGLAVCSSFSTGVFAATDVVKQGGCSECGEYLSVVLVCNKSKYYSYERTHKSNGQVCTVIVYESSYRGKFCRECGAEQNMPDADYSHRHLCTERHSSCGLGLVGRSECLAGDPLPWSPGI